MWKDWRLTYIAEAQQAVLFRRTRQVHRAEQPARLWISSVFHDKRVEVSDFGQGSLIEVEGPKICVGGQLKL